MSSSLQQALALIRKDSKNDTELGTAFEKLSKVFFLPNRFQINFYTSVVTLL